jgi:hypothetical protein
LDQTVKVLGVATINEALIKGSEIDSIVIMLIVKVQGAWQRWAVVGVGRLGALTTGQTMIDIDTRTTHSRW